ncbi:MAG: hypothetical protein FJW40_24800 [Acidobacteria bacterium]|nr:hypothetical protein [Acidobacteriota bacterium]
MAPNWMVCAAVAAGAAWGQESSRSILLSHAQAGQQAQEIATIVRTMAEPEFVMAPAGSATLALRGTPASVTLGAWLVAQLDQPPGSRPPSETAAAGQPAEFVRVFYLAHTGTVQGLQEIATIVRSAGDIRRVFTYNALRAIVVRGTEAQVALSSWLIEKLDREAADANPGEFRVGAAPEEIARVFALSHVAGAQGLQEIATVVRATTGIRRLFTQQGLRLIVARGSADELALAAWLLSRLDLPEGSGRPTEVDYQGAVPGGEVAGVVYLPGDLTPQAIQERAVLARGLSRVPRLMTAPSVRAVALRGTAEQVRAARTALVP